MPLIDLDNYDAFETADLPGQGDVDAGGGGITTSSLTNENVLDSIGQGHRAGGRHLDPNTGKPIGKHMTPGLAGNPKAEHPFWTVVIILIVLGLMKFVPKEEGESEKPIKIGINNGVRITLMGVLGLLLLKFVFGIFLVSSISPTIEYV